MPGAEPVAACGSERRHGSRFFRRWEREHRRRGCERHGSERRRRQCRCHARRGRRAERRKPDARRRAHRAPFPTWTQRPRLRSIDVDTADSNPGRRRQEQAERIRQHPLRLFLQAGAISGRRPRRLLRASDRDSAHRPTTSRSPAPYGPSPSSAATTQPRRSGVRSRTWRSCPRQTTTSRSGRSRKAPRCAVPISKGRSHLSDNGWSSGGFIADTKIDTVIDSGTQQQFYRATRIYRSGKAARTTWCSWATRPPPPRAGRVGRTRSATNADHPREALSVHRQGRKLLRSRTVP